MNSLFKAQTITPKCMLIIAIIGAVFMLTCDLMFYSISILAPEIKRTLSQPNIELPQVSILAFSYYKYGFFIVAIGTLASCLSFVKSLQQHVCVFFAVIFVSVAFSAIYLFVMFLGAGVHLLPFCGQIQ